MSSNDIPTASEIYRKALGLLVRREHSQRELKRKLQAKGIEVTAAASALETLTAQGYQDDSRFAEMLVRTRLSAGYGPLHIRAELGTHAIDSGTIQQVLADAEPDWTERAREALRRRYGERPPANRAESIKRSHFLQRRGFDAASIRAALQARSGD
jgi:regulatory protein